MKKTNIIAAATFVVILLSTGIAGAGYFQPEPKQLAPEETKLIVDVRDFILESDYRSAAGRLRAFVADHPTNPLGPTGYMLLYQAQMYEHLNFYQQKNYEQVYRMNLRLSEPYKDKTGSDPWRALFYGAAEGVHGIFLTRTQDWVSAFASGIKGMITLDRITRAHPDMIDARLGEGILRYWRGAKAADLNLPIVFADDKEAGLNMLLKVAAEAELTGPMAAMAALYALYVDGEFSRALTIIEELQQKYPHGFIIRIMKARCYYRLKQYSLARTELESLRKDFPDHGAPHYHLGYVSLLEKKPEPAREHLHTFLEYTMEDRWRSFGLFRLAEAYEKTGELDEAKRLYLQAIRYYDGYEYPQKGLERVEKKLDDIKAANRKMEQRTKEHLRRVIELKERLKSGRPENSK